MGRVGWVGRVAAAATLGPRLCHPPLWPLTTLATPPSPRPPHNSGHLARPLSHSTLGLLQIQYPGAAATMADDLRHVRVWARILSKNEIAFDMLSAVDELNAQVALEFDFGREARVMDTVAGHLEAREWGLGRGGGGGGIRGVGSS